MLQPRLYRYKNFLQNEFADSILWNNDFEFLNFSNDIIDKFKNKQFDTIIFYGMGCSAIVADILKGIFIHENIPIKIIILNDYQTEYIVYTENYNNNSTLFIICSYSGRTPEPILFFKKIKKNTTNIVFLTAGGKLLKVAYRNKIPTIRWLLRNPDPEYPLFHVPQFFSILLNVFYNLKFLKRNYINELTFISEEIKYNVIKNSFNNYNDFSKSLRNAEIILISSPMWYLILLKLIKMHLNEVAMSSAHRNFLHEFTHSEIATFSNSKQKKSIIIFKDLNEDKLTSEKIKLVSQFLDKKYFENRNIELFVFEILGKNLLERFYFTIFKFYYITYYLGKYNNTLNRDLIYNTAKYDN